MNLSSIILSTHPDNTLELINDLKAGKICEYHLHDDLGRIIVTIEERSASEEVARLQELKSHPLVIDAVMHFSYAESELEDAREELMSDIDNIPSWLNDPNARLRDIKYQGDLKGKL